VCVLWGEGGCGYSSRKVEGEEQVEVWVAVKKRWNEMRGGTNEETQVLKRRYRTKTRELLWQENE